MHRVCDMFQSPLACMSRWATSSVFAERVVTLFLLSNWRGGSVAILCVRKKWGCDVMSLIMMNSWEATHVADHGVIDSELLKLHVWGGVVWLLTMLQVYSASLNHPCSSSGRTESHEEEPLVSFVSSRGENTVEPPWADTPRSGHTP